MAGMFEIKGDRAMWRILYEDKLRDMEIGEVVCYEELEGLLPHAAEGSWRSAFTRAMKEMEIHHRRTFANVRGVGYKMVEAQEHEGLAHMHRRRSYRQLKRGVQRVASADRSRLNTEEIQRFERLEINFSRQEQMIRRLNERTTANEKAIQDARRQSSAEVAEVQGRVERLEQLLRERGYAEE